MSHIGHNGGPLDPFAIAAEMGKRGEEWADKHAAAEALEEAQKSVLAEIAADYKATNAKTSMAEAETFARASRKYREFVAEMVEARRLANRARVRFDTWRAYIEMLRSREATQRAEMTLR